MLFRSAQPVSVAVAAAAALVLTGWAISRGRSLPVIASLVVILGIGAGVAWFSGWLATAGATTATLILGAELLVLGCVGLTALLLRYADHRPESRLFSVITVVVVAVLGTVSLWAAQDKPHPLLVAGFHLAEPLYLGLTVVWGLMLLATWGSLLCGIMLSITHVAKKREWPATARAVWTVLLTLSLPSLLFLLITCGIWWGVAQSVPPLGDGIYTPWPIPIIKLPTPKSFTEFSSLLIRQAVGDGLGLMLLMFALALVVLAWALGPIVWAEVFPPTHNRRTAVMGRWLTNGFGLANVSGLLFAVAFLVVLPLGAIAGQPYATALRGVDDTLKALESRLNLGLITGLIGIPAASLFVFAKNLKPIVAGFRTPLDILLDVDNYLRVHPLAHTTKARIFARYKSLLDGLSASYDAVIVVAHSQGTVISADLFRLLSTTRQMSATPLYFFTMGSPLRQLYARRFPELYEWVWNSATPIDTLKTPDIPDDCRPEPSELGVARWVNAYRSGDYVGRWLWRPDICGYQFNAAPQRSPWTAINSSLPGHSHDPSQTRFELCVGAGAHTHYWYGTAPEVALEMDLLIRT